MTQALQSVASLPALGPWAPPAERGPSLESIYRVSLTVDLCEGNKTISLKKFISPQPVGGPQKEKNPGALGSCPVCPLVKTALAAIPDSADLDDLAAQGIQDLESHKYKTDFIETDEWDLRLQYHSQYLC